VMELVEGETLADRIVRGPVPMDDALLVARQIAEALDAAHATFFDAPAEGPLLIPAAPGLLSRYGHGGPQRDQSHDRTVYRLFLPQRAHRVDLGGACGGNPRRQQARGDDHNQTRGIGHRIGDVHDLRDVRDQSVHYRPRRLRQNQPGHLL
jgi:hypothetical protein